MPRCTSCGEYLRESRDKLGARCPNCRDPIFEEPRDPHHGAASLETTAQSRCAVHANNGAVGTCQRCGNYLCSVCWTRWLGKAICIGCVERALEAGEALPSELRAHSRQALLSMTFGVIAWIITLIAVIMMVKGMSGQMNLILVGFGVLVLIASPVPAVLGVGQGAAAIRARGHHMILATIGLILSGLHAGLIVGLFTMSVIHE